MKETVPSIFLFLQLLMMVITKPASAFSSRWWFPSKKSSLTEQRKQTSKILPMEKLRLSSSEDHNDDYDETLLWNEKFNGSRKEGPNSAGQLSKRGSSLPPLRDDLDVFEKGLNDPFHPVDNPDGYIVMLVAENKLLLPELNAKLRSIQTKNAQSLPDWIFGYGDFGGDERFRTVVAKNVVERFSGGAIVDPNSLRFQAGAGSVLNLLALCLGDPNDGVLVTGPTYPAFPADFEMIAHMKLHVCDTNAAQRYVPTADQLETCYERMVRAGNPPKIFLVCQPNNPTGVVYTYKEMEAMIDWALSKEGMHVVSDEIYALSVFPGIEFTSALRVMNDKQTKQKEQQSPNSDSSDSDSADSEHISNNHYLGDRVHVVYGLSKDWGMSGFRIGTLVSHNHALLEAFGQLGYYAGVSQYTQHVLTELLSNKKWIDWYVMENRKRLKDNYEALVKALEPVGVKIPVPAEGSHFCWADFSCFLDDSKTSQEDLWLELSSEDNKVLLTTGTSCFEDKPGMFRIVHPWPEGGTQAMEELGRRLVKWKAKRDLQ